MKHRKEKEIKVIFAGIALIFLTFLAVPMVQLLMKSFTTEGGGRETGASDPSVREAAV